MLYYIIITSHSAIVAYLKHNTEDVKTNPRKFRKHKGLVLTLLSALAILTHASIRTPVKMPYSPLLGNKEPVSGTVLEQAHDTLLSHAPKGIQQ